MDTGPTVGPTSEESGRTDGLRNPRRSGARTQAGQSRGDALPNAMPTRLPVDSRADGSDPMMGDYLYTLRNNAPAWLADHADVEPFTVDDAAYWLDLPTWMVAGIVDGCCDRWEIVATVDHGARTADETMVYECAILADIIMLPVLSAMIGRDVTCDLDSWAAACEKIAPYDGGWCEPTDDDPYSERATWLHESVVWYRSYDQCSDVIVETSGDAGMTWFAVRVADGAR